MLDSREIYSQASLVITRSGRNTLSELAFLGIPAITFITGCIYRKEEQKQNISQLKVNNIEVAEIGIKPIDFAIQCRNSIEKRCSNNGFLPGNQYAIKEIISLLDTDNE